MRNCSVLTLSLSKGEVRPAEPDEMVQWTISSTERPELKRGAGEGNPALDNRFIDKGAAFPVLDLHDPEIRIECDLFVAPL